MFKATESREVQITCKNLKGNLAFIHFFFTLIHYKFGYSSQKEIPFDKGLTGI